MLEVAAQAPEVYYLPETLRYWPWERIISPWYRAAQNESVAWLEGHKAFTPQGQVAFNKCDFSLVSALTFPKANYYNLRSCCDLMHTFFTLDEHTDNLPLETVKERCEATMDAILDTDKPRPAGESVVGQMAKEFWGRAKIPAPIPVRERFEKAWRMYIDSVIEQAERRETRHICTIDEYMKARRDNIGSDPSFALLEISLGLDLPHEIMEHPAIASLNSDTSDMIVLANDMCSWKKEKIADDYDYNAVHVVMKNNKVDTMGALQWISDKHDEVVANFMRVRDDVLNKRNGCPSWGKEYDEQVAEYIDGLGQWIRGHDEWNFGSGRYFGDDGHVVQKTRKVVIA